MASESVDRFAYAIANRLQSGWTTRTYLAELPKLGNLYVWRVLPTGTTILIREAEAHPTADDVVRYEEVR